MSADRHQPPAAAGVHDAPAPAIDTLAVDAAWRLLVVPERTPDDEDHAAAGMSEAQFCQPARFNFGCPA